MAENAAVPVDDQSSLHDAHNALVYRDAGNANYPAKVIWRNTSADYILDADNATGNHANFGSGVLLVQDSGVTVGVPLTITDLLASGNLAWKSGTAFKITLDHAATADRVITVPDATDTLALLGRTQTLTGTNTFSQQIISTLAIGTAPFAPTSTTVCPNLNADMVDGRQPGTASGDIAFYNGSGRVVDSELVDGRQPGTGSGDLAILDASARVQDSQQLDGIDSTGFARLGFANAGNLLFVDATYTIGLSGADRPLDVFVARDGIYGRDLEVVRNLFVDGGQIAFPATQVPSAGANTLDDYEEGTWTPALGGSTTYTTQSAAYIKVGRVVTIWGVISVNALGTGSATTISGLPFGGTDFNDSPIAVTKWQSLAVAPVFLSFRATGSTLVADGLTAAGVTCGTLNIFGAGATVYFAGAYRTAS